MVLRSSTASQWLVSVSVAAAMGCSSGDAEPSGARDHPELQANESTTQQTRSGDEAAARDDADESLLTATAPGAAARAMQPGAGRPGPEEAKRNEPAEGRADERGATDVDGLGLRRLVVTGGVEDREPVGDIERLDAGSERVYAFLELRNDSERERSVMVTFEGPRGRETGFVELSVPAHQPRWRTWGYSQHVTTAGSWRAVVTTAEGERLGHADFVVSERHGS